VRIARGTAEEEYLRLGDWPVQWETKLNADCKAMHVEEKTILIQHRNIDFPADSILHSSGAA